MEGDDPSAGGYVTLHDRLGDFMEVKGFDAITYGGEIYKEVSSSVSDEANGAKRYTYTFTGTGKPANAFYPNNVELDTILIDVVRYADGTGDDVTVKVPASALPMRQYDVKTDVNGNTTLTISDTNPISVFYSVGLQDGVKEALQLGSAENMNRDTAYKTKLENYVADNADQNGNISFYANAYTKGSALGDATASFVPATNNPFYYYTEDTPLYTDKECTAPLKQTLSVGNTIYYKYNYYEKSGDETVLKTAVVEVNIQPQDHINKIEKDSSGNYYVPKNTRRDSIVRVLDSQLGSKEGNPTETAGMRIDFAWEGDGTTGSLYLGNNGRLTYPAAGSLRITKKVTADPGANPSADTEFTAVVSFKDASGKPLSGAYSYYTNGEKLQTVQLQNGAATLTLKADDELRFIGLPAGATYTVTEEAVPAHYAQETIENASGTIEAGKNTDRAPLVTITNRYTPESVTTGTDGTPFRVRKELSGSEASGDLVSWDNVPAGTSFEIRLEALNGAPLPDNTDVKTTADNVRYITTTIKDGDIYNFGQVTFTKPGTYVYNLRETLPSSKVPGFSYTNAVFRVTVTVTDDNGKLKAEYKTEMLDGTNGNHSRFDAEQDVSVFDNVFDAKLENISLRAWKVFSDPADPADTLQAGQYTFTLTAETPDAPMPDKTTACNLGDGLVSFEKITYTKDDINKTYSYLIKETPGNDPSVQYSGDIYKAVVKVGSKTVNGELVVDPVVTYCKKQANGSFSELEDGFQSVIFTNSRKITNATATLQASKTLTGRGWGDNDAFTFILKGQGNAPMPDKTKATATAKDKTAVFGDISYSQVGTYTYTIEEEAGALENMAYDSHTETVTVTVTRENGTLKAAVRYSSGETAAVFENTYTPTPLTVNTSALFKVHKDLKGRAWNDRDLFTFTLTPLQDAPAVTGSTTVSINRTPEEHTTQIGDSVTFTKAGVYKYKITEDKGSISGITYDDTVYTVIVTVTDDGKGKLSADVAYQQNDSAYTAVDNTVVFTNQYAAESVTLSGKENLTVNKLLTGRDWGDDETFIFTLTGKDNAPMPAANTITVGKSGTASFGDITYSQPGTYTYTIEEDQNTGNSITIWDSRSYTVTVTVTDDGSGQLKASSAMTNSDGQTVREAEFINIYAENTKTVTGSDGQLADGTLAVPGTELTYTIRWIAARDGDATITDTIPANTSYVADSADNGGVYDESSRTLTWSFSGLHAGDSGTVRFTVTVNEDAEANIDIQNTAYVKVGDHDPMQTNTTHNRAAFTLEATKELTGRELKKEEFQFVIKKPKAEGEEEDTIKVTATNDADGRIRFDTSGLDFTPGQHSYLITEINNQLGGVTYDSAVYQLDYTVEEKDGCLTLVSGPTITLNGEPAEKIVFHNSYDPKLDTGNGFTIHATKELTGRSLQDAEFYFVVKDSEGKTVAVGTNDANGNIDFGTIGSNKVTTQAAAQPPQESDAAVDAPQEDLTEEPAASSGSEQQEPADAPQEAASEAAASSEAGANSEPAASSEAAASSEPTANSEAAASSELPAASEPAENAESGAASEPAAASEPSVSSAPVEVQSAAANALAAAAKPMALHILPLSVETPAMPEEPVSSPAPDLDEQDTPVPENGQEQPLEEQEPSEPEAQALKELWYTVEESAGPDSEGITYDSTKFLVCVPLHDDGNGKLTYDTDNIKYYEADGKTPVEKIVFKNSYSAKGENEDGSTSATLTAKKMLEGRTLQAGEFTFVLKENDKVIATTTNDAEGSVSFTLFYTDEYGIGEQEKHTYTISEVKGNDPQITYDESALTYTVTVIDDGHGNLSAAVDVPAQNVLKNIYTAPTPTPTPKPDKPSSSTTATPTPAPEPTATPAPTPFTAVTPKTGDSSNLAAMAALAAACAAALIGLLVYRKNKNGK